MATSVPAHRYTARNVVPPRQPRHSIASHGARQLLPPVHQSASAASSRNGTRHSTEPSRNNPRKTRSWQTQQGLPPIREPAPASRAAERQSPEDERCDKLRKVFQKFDADGNGTISRDELGYVLQRLGDFRSADIDAIMLEVDRNENGVIEYEEFLQWVVTPGCVVAVDSGRAAIFDMKQALRPLFDVYDVDHNNKISKQEFVEMQTMIKAFIDSAPIAEDQSSVALLAAGDVADIFGEADADCDEQIDFEEFVEWQREAILHSGIPHDRLTELFQKLAVLLQAVAVLIPRGRGASDRRNSSRDPVLGKMVEDCAATCRELWRKDKKEKGTFRGSFTEMPGLEDPEVVARETKVMQEAPRGLSVKGLLAKHVAEPLPAGEHDEVNLHVQIYPAAGGEAEESEHRWVARVGRQTLHKKRKIGDNFYYYEFNDGSWAESPCADDFHEASAALSPQLRCYSLLLARSNFTQIGLPWDTVQLALHEAEQHNIFSKEELLEYTVGMEATIVDMCSDKKFKERLKDAAPESRKEDVRKLMQKVVLTPLQVMASLTDMGVLPGHALWTG